MRKTKEKRQPLKQGDIFTLPCGAKIETMFAYENWVGNGPLIQFKITAGNAAIATEDDKSLPSIKLGFYGKNIPEMIEILKRAELVGKE